MISENAFIQAVIAEPDDDAPRLIYADWLDEQGQSERAEFIRLQCQIAQLSKGNHRRKELATWARALLADHGKVWVMPFQGLATHFRFRRGFVEAVRVPARLVVSGTNGLRQLAPIRDVFVTVAQEVIDRVPESVARENIILPLHYDGGRFWIAMSNANDRDMIDKLAFILNRDIIRVTMRDKEIREGINRHYGDTEVEFVDCCSFHDAVGSR